MQNLNMIVDIIKLLALRVPSSGPIVCFHNVELETLDVEVSYEIALPVEPSGDVIACIVPSCTVASTIDRGPYEMQAATLDELMKWIPEHGFAANGGIYYHYLNDEEQLQNEYLTEMYIPVKQSQ